MCGISGIYSLKITEQHHSLIQDIIKSQMRRGPDHQAALVIRGRESEVLFGHNRLSIIDLSEQANQPLWDASRRFCIVYNGEIYNYLELRQKLKAAGLQFNTQSDTEVILNAFAYWGIEALQYFQGPFAFALWDSQEERLWLCRDRFGVKPLYYIQKNQVLYFASTTPALARALNLTPNYSYLAQGLQYLVYEDNSDRSPYEGLQALPAGCYLSARFNSEQQFTCSIHSYYDLESRLQNRIEQLAASGQGAMLALLTHQF